MFGPLSDPPDPAMRHSDDMDARDDRREPTKVLASVFFTIRFGVMAVPTNITTHGPIAHETLAYNALTTDD